MSQKKLRKLMAEFYSSPESKLVLKAQERTFEIQKVIDDIAISYPYSLTSETLQRTTFCLVAIESNENSTIIFEEPQAHVFPYYTVYLGERIARDQSNQYFFSTHSPYLLRSIVEDAGSDEVSAFVTYTENHETKIEPFNEKNMSVFMEGDPCVQNSDIAK